MAAPTPSLEAFSDEVTTFLDARAERRAVGADDQVHEDDYAEAEVVAAAKAWQHERFEAGLGWITGPAEFGGRELSVDFERRYRELEKDYEVPNTSLLGPGLTIIASAILAHSSDTGRAKYLPGLFSGDIVACQLFSEPSTGSDLAGVQTRAAPDGDGWLITGQKVWTSGAHRSDVGEAVCRTNLDVPKHKGITIFMVDMSAPGVEIRPLRDATGEVHFNEVFLTDVRVSDDDRVGPVDDGWRVLNTSLMNERALVGDMNEGRRDRATPDALLDVMRELSLLDDPVLRDGLADLIVRFRVAESLTKHMNARLQRGEMPGPEMSMTKLTFSDNQERLVNFAATALGAAITADGGDELSFPWAQRLLSGRSMRIAGGTDEIQRTILGERVLHLPRDQSIDNSVPFRDIPRSTRQTQAGERG
jgi:acyl-CoA dehydrogenase